MNPLNDPSTTIQAIRQTSPYINAHRGKTFVIMIDGETQLSPTFASIVHDIALLHSLGVRLVLVAGSRPQIDAELNRQGLTTEIHQGKRITDADTLGIIKQVSGKCRYEFEAQFSNGLPNTPMHGANIRLVSGNFVSGRPLGVIDGHDFQFTGTVRKVDTQAINNLLDNGSVVLTSNIAFSATAECFNLAAEEVAVALAGALQADKFIVFSNPQQLKPLPRELQPKQARSLLTDAKTQHSLHCALQACEAGISRSHIVNFEQDGSLLMELFTTDGVGTLISRESFETIRSANINDVGGIMALLEPLEQNGTLVKRERELLEQEIEHFIVIDRDDKVIGCSALYPYDDAKAEIACVVTDPDYRGGQRGMQMLHHLETTARNKGLREVFVLTTQSAHFFVEQGFVETGVDYLPARKQQLYNLQRNSKVFHKQL